MKKQPFGTLPGGEQASLYTISGGNMQAQISDYGATLVRLYVPDSRGVAEDVVLGYDDVGAYINNDAHFGAIEGRNANRIKGASFLLNGARVQMTVNNGNNNLHSGPDCFAFRLWEAELYASDRVRFLLRSPHGDQGFPGNAEIRVTYAICLENTLSVTYEALCDRDTVFNMTNHSYFNLAGHRAQERAMEQMLEIPSSLFVPSDAESIPTGQLRAVEGTPMDFRTPKAVGQDIDRDYECLRLQHGYDHTYQVETNPCLILTDPVSGRRMEVSTDCPGIHIYAGNFIDVPRGKDGVSYGRRSGLAIEAQFYPDSVNKPHWPQPVVKAGEQYRSETRYTFK